MSNRSRHTALAIVLLALLVALPAAANINLAREIANPGFNRERTSIAVVDAESGETLAAYQPGLELNPASCAKLLTTATALSLLGPDYRFHTNFYADRQIAAGAIGTLFVSGNGDPKLVTEELWQVAQALAARGLRQVTDGIVIDNSYFDSFEFPRKPGNEGRAYTAKTSAVAVNHNSIGIEVGPGPRAGLPGKVTLDPPLAGYRIVNRLVTRGRFSAAIALAGDTVTVTGHVPPRFEPQLFWRSVDDPVSYAGEVIRWVFAQNGIEVAGPVRAGRVAPEAVQIASAPSRPLSEIVEDMNKFSNNFIAEQIVKHLGAVRRGAPGSTAKGVEVIRDYLASIGIPRDAYELENGSGLSERTRVSAATLAKVLVAAWRSRTLHKPFVESLSILGVDGTMKSWGRQAPELVGVLLGKTGTINGVSALAGYVPMPNGRMAAFAILANSVPKGAWGAHRAQLAVARAVAGGAR